MSRFLSLVVEQVKVQSTTLKVRTADDLPGRSPSVWRETQGVLSKTSRSPSLFR